MRVCLPALLATRPGAGAYSSGAPCEATEPAVSGKKLGTDHRLHSASSVVFVGSVNGTTGGVVAGHIGSGKAGWLTPYLYVYLYIAHTVSRNWAAGVLPCQSRATSGPATTCALPAVTLCLRRAAAYLSGGGAGRRVCDSVCLAGPGVLSRAFCLGSLGIASPGGRWSGCSLRLKGAPGQHTGSRHHRHGGTVAGTARRQACAVCVLLGPPVLP